VLVLKGPVEAPKRTLDVSALTGWLALRAADQQARHIEAIEVIRRSSPIGPIVRPQSPAVRATAPGTATESGPSAAAAANARNAVGLDLLRRERVLRAPGDAAPAAVEDASASSGAPAEGQAPPLPAPIEVKPVPGSAGSVPARVPRIVQPPAGNVRPPLDLLRP
jgi:large subunit ribosomal protein L24